MELSTLVCANLMEDIGSGHAALLIANYPIMALHTPLVSISSYPITAQHRWLKSPESAVAPFYATDNLLSGVFFSSTSPTSSLFLFLSLCCGCLWLPPRGFIKCIMCNTAMLYVVVCVTCWCSSETSTWMRGATL